MVGSVVTSSSSMIRGWVRAYIGPDGRPRPPGSPDWEGGCLNGHAARQPTTGGTPGTKRQVPVRWARVRGAVPPPSRPRSAAGSCPRPGPAALIVVTGAPVRLTGSGSVQRLAGVLGRAPDAGVHLHGLIEFGNRLVTVVVTIRWRRPSSAPSSVPLAGATSSGSAEASWPACWPRPSSAGSSSTRSSTPTSSWCTSTHRCCCWSTPWSWCTAPPRLHAPDRPASSCRVPRSGSTTGSWRCWRW